MKYYSTSDKTIRKSLREAVVEGLAPGGGLYMPERIEKLAPGQLASFRNKSFPAIAQEIAVLLFGSDLAENDITDITCSAVNFDIPLVKVEDRIFSLELFHGPTLAFKDVGARFMARMLGHFTKDSEREINVLVATSGDTGSAVANGFWNVDGIRVFILYPGGGVSQLQEKQLTTLGGNITALEIKGTFDDCQDLVKKAFSDSELREKHILTSANSINLARFLPQSFYYFNAYARLPVDDEFIVSVPSGNFGNLTAGLIAGRMGLPVHHYVVATNVNDVVPEYLETGIFSPRPSTPTIANAMDVGNPSNFARILDLFRQSHPDICNSLSGYSFSDDELRKTMLEVYKKTGYLPDPHGAAGYQALLDHLQTCSGSRYSEIQGVFLETAHPAKFADTVKEATGLQLKLPEVLQQASGRAKNSIPLSNNYSDFSDFLSHAAG